jgi:hypothetical protein
VIHSKERCPKLADTAPSAHTHTHTRCGGMAAVVDGPSHYARSSLAALDVPQHELSMVQLGFGDITAFAGFDDATPSRTLRN